MKNAIDIIIPIYNAYDELKTCLDSIFKYTDLTNNRLILINDCSTDTRINGLLDEVQRENIVVISNETNQGFSANINTGMRQSEDRDVILLNSDTVVTKKWVEKIVACAYSDASIGTVTPLSNNATLCSVPEFCKENVLPQGFSIDDFADLVERCSLKKYPQITVANGFCMLVKREVIDKIGFFDAATFGRGYGEENDFCNRAGQMGYIHVMCDDTYIYHNGTKSFISEEKQKLIDEHDRILQNRYEEQIQKNREHCRDNPNKNIQDNIKFYLEKRNGRRNVLFLAQADFREGAKDNIGGIQLHVKDLVDQLKNDYNVYVAARDGDTISLSIYIGSKVELLEFYVGEEPLYPLYHSGKFKAIYQNILNAFQIDIVHIHHTKGMTLEMFYAAKQLNIPIIATLHDFYYICPTVKLLDKANNVCYQHESYDKCRECLQKKEKITGSVEFMQQWRAFSREVLSFCDWIIAPSENAREIYGNYYPELKEQIHVVEHGIEGIVPANREDQSRIVYETEEVKYWIEEIQYKESYCTVIRGWAYLENTDMSRARIYLDITDSKGVTTRCLTTVNDRWDVAGQNSDRLKSGFSCYLPQRKMADGQFKINVVIKYQGEIFTNGHPYKIAYHKLNRNNRLNVAFIGGLNEAKGGLLAYDLIRNNKNDVNWFVFGGIGSYQLEYLKQKNLTKTGYYDKEELPTLLEQHGIDIVCILSIWPETYCYTLQEALACGIPVIVSDIGALGDRAKKLGGGFTVPIDEGYQNILQLIVKISKNRELCEEKKAAVQKLIFRNLDEMIRDYKEIYGRYKGDISYQNFSSEAILKAYRLGNMQELYSEENSDFVERYLLLESQLQEINSSFVYKVVKRLSALPIPFKRQLKKLIYKIGKGK